eukprot:TRINITY_DN9500_c0_g1_i1.p1 TRINITY_DN9500_c0_g1~~TRINITY_DN9500_c0_g1_i1.p1  ORF type:complete len:158 (-),score=20.50 TRINITY_DN9500_c0_g1_i1:391-864(-)
MSWTISKHLPRLAEKGWLELPPDLRLGWAPSPADTMRTGDKPTVCDPGITSWNRCQRITTQAVEYSANFCAKVDAESCNCLTSPVTCIPEQRVHSSCWRKPDRIQCFLVLLAAGRRSKNMRLPGTPADDHKSQRTSQLTCVSCTEFCSRDKICQPSI